MAKVAVTEKSLIILDFLRENKDGNFTAADIAEAVGMEKKSVDGVVTRGLASKGYAVRIPAEITLDDGSHKGINLIKATEAGLAYDHDAALAIDAEAAAQAKAEKEEA